MAMQCNTLTLSIFAPITDRLFITNSKQSSVLPLLSLLISEILFFCFLFELIPYQNNLEL